MAKAPQKLKRFGKITYTKLTMMFVLLFAVGIFMLIDNSFDTPKTVAAAANPGLSASALVITVPLLTLLMALASQFDRRCAEDYSFQLMANAALVAVITMLLFNMFSNLDFLNDLTGLRKIHGDDLVGITMVSWASAFFYFQRKGLQ